jgi:uncharacterized coiled-coil protein SlyX
MRLITLLAGYAAWLAVAMKYRKDAGTSKVEADPNKSKMDSIIDEIVDIHKTAFADIKSAVSVTWEEVEDFDTLKGKVEAMADGFATDLEAKVTELRATGTAKKDELLAHLDTALADKEAAIESARTKALAFGDVALDTLDTFLADARKKLTAAHKKIKAKVEKETV